MNIAEKLQELRKQKGISQPKLCEELEKTQGVYMAISTLRNYENVNNPRIPKNEILNALAKYYNVDIEYLLNDEAENITTENIKINKLLGLDDRAIEVLKTIQRMNEIYEDAEISYLMKDTLNRFICDSDFIGTIMNLTNLKMLYRTNKQHENINKIVDEIYSEDREKALSKNRLKEIEKIWVFFCGSC